MQPEHAPDWGDYQLLVGDAADGTLLFRAGFDSNIDPAAAAAATELSVRLPALDRPARASVRKRRAAGVFQELWSTAIDPRDPMLDASAPALSARVDPILVNGAPASKVDIAILGDGYRESEYGRFLSDARHAADFLFSVEPFTARMRDFNVYAVFTPSAETGATDPYAGTRKHTAFGCAYGTGATERTLAARDHFALCDVASAVSYDFVLVLVNARRYGGSAYFGGPAVVSMRNAAARYLVLHEFGHVIGGLADEYYIPARDGPVFRGNVEPWHPNVTISPGNAKWQALRSDGAASDPGTWNKTAYDTYFADYVKRYFKLRDTRADESAVERFMSTERERQRALLAQNTLRHVGFFEGATGYARGMFRSEVDCIMFSLQTEYFCHACSAAIERMIDAHTR